MNHKKTGISGTNIPSIQIARSAVLLLVLVIFMSCAHGIPSESWKTHYSHLSEPLPQKHTINETDYYIVFLVAAYHLDYWDNRALFSTLIQYSRRKENIGHSWIYLKGIKDGRPLVLEGSQSGQLGEEEPRFSNGVMNYIRYGYANPTESQKKNPRYEPNPVKYMWEDLSDGFFQEGNGDYRPTYAAKVDLTREQFEEILDYIDPARYPYEIFSLVGNQCSSFVASLASMAGLPLEHRVTVKLDPVITAKGREFRLWSDTRYSEITFSSPDIIERSLMKAVADERAEYALGWYLNRE